MGLKIFGKGSQFEGKAQDNESDATQNRIEKLEASLSDLGSEVIKLRQEVNTLLARQYTFKMALRRLREFLEGRGNQEENETVHEEVAANFQEISVDYESNERPALELAEAAPRSNKDKTSLH